MGKAAVGRGLTKRTSFPLPDPNLDTSDESWFVSLIDGLSFVPGGLPGGPLVRFGRLGCRSAICSDLPFFFASVFGVPLFSSLPEDFLGVDVLSARLNFVLASDGSSESGTNALSSASAGWFEAPEIR